MQTPSIGLTRNQKFVIGGCLGLIALCILARGVYFAATSSKVTLPVCNAPANAPVILPSGAMQQDKGNAPQGSLAFVNKGDLIVVQLKDGSAANLTRNLPDIQSIRWSSGTDLAAVVLKDKDVWVLDPGAQTSQHVFSTADKVYDMLWSPDGRRLAVRSSSSPQDDPGRLDLFDISKAAAPKAIGSLSLFKTGALEWSPDGESLLIPDLKYSGKDVTGFTVWKVDPPRDEARHLASAIGSGPLWSPDGRWIATQCLIDESGWETWSTCLADPQDPAGDKHYPGGTTLFSPAVWSPDSRWLASAGWHDGQHWLDLLDPENGALSEKGCTDGAFAPSWSPDSRHLLFYYDNAMGIIEPDGSNLVVVSDGLSWFNAYIVWSPDGTGLAASVTMAKPNGIGLYAFSLDGTTRKHVQYGTDDAFVLPHSLTWLP